MSTTWPQSQVEGFPTAGSSLGLLTIPFIFTQDDLLTAENFIKRAEKLGHRLSLDLLQKLHERRLLVPLYRVSDTPVVGRQIHHIDINGSYDVRRWVLEGATEGRVHDSADEGYSAAWPYARPKRERNTSWWNGFAFSSWQLLDVAEAITQYQWIQNDWPTPRTRGAIKHRRRTQALAALSTRYLPSIIGRLSQFPGTDEDHLWQMRFESDPRQFLRVAGFDPANLLEEAERLLREAQHRDPMAEWLPLLRHGSYEGWAKLKGEPLACMWRRIGAEVLLRAHEELAAAGQLDPLPDISGLSGHTALHDRLTARYDEAETLERALGSFGLSPHPRVLLLVEGETELIHVPQLLAQLGIDKPQQVRVQRCKGSHVNTQLIARYNVTPRIGKRYETFWLLDATPTALVIAVDPENKWATEAKRAVELRKMQDDIREEVRWQGADISQEDLDYLVKVEIWGEDKYELANFTDDELTAVVRKIAERRSAPNPLPADWDGRFLGLLTDARREHKDIKVPLGRMGLGDPKVALAKLLLPVLLAKCKRELDAGAVETPVLELVLKVRQIVANLSASGYSLKIPEGFAD